MDNANEVRKLLAEVPAMTPCVAYERCSSVNSVFGDTWERQTAAIASCANLKGFEVIEEYREEAVPGKLDEDSRPAFQRMVADLLGNGCRTIIVESLDRLAREYRIQEHLVIYLATKGLTLIAANTGENITEAMNSDPMRRALVQIQGIFAELEKNMIVAKLRKARERQRSKIGRCEGRKAYGHLPEEKETLDWIIKNARQGQSADAIANALDALRIPTRYGKRWHSGTVAKILKREEAKKLLGMSKSA